MKLPSIRRLSREDVPGAPDWISSLLYIINLFFEQLYIGLNKGLTFADNFRGETKVFTIIGSSVPTDNVFIFDSTAVNEPLAITLKRIIRSDRVADPFTQAPWIDAQWIAGKIQIYSIVGLKDGVKYEITLEISFQ